ncbi:MAG: ABC transporter permease, partial [Planctomycetes bacterium]|nr:ABC transporter permease [Planctomycetota bacterium]
VGVALGIAVLVAVRLASGSALRSFRDTVLGVAGRTEYEVRGVAGPLPESVYRTVATFPGIAAAAPLLERGAVLRGETNEGVTVLGVDLLADAGVRDYGLSDDAAAGPAVLQALTHRDSVLVAEKLATRRGIREGDAIRILVDDRERTLRVAGLLRFDGPARALDGSLLVLDVGAAQEIFGAAGVLDRIDIVLRPDVPRDAFLAELRASLPANVEVAPPAARGDAVERLLRAYRVNLAALGFLAVIVGAFLVYNSVSVSVARRRPAIATVRALGLSRRIVAAAFLAEGTAIGALGSVLGVGLGWVLARGILGTVTRTIGYHYVRTRVSGIAFDGESVAVALLLGPLLAAAASLVPAIDAARVPPSRALRRGALEVARGGTGVLAAIGVLLLGLAALAARGPAIGGIPVSGYASAMLVISGAVLLAPGFLVLVSRIVPLLASPILGAEGDVAAAGIRAAPGRTAVAACGLLVGLAMTVSVGTLVGSFRVTVDRWIEQTVKADLWVSPLARASGQRGATMGRDAVDAIRRAPGVADVDPFLELSVELPSGGIVSVSSGDFAATARHVEIPFLRGDSHATLERAAREGLSIVSEVLANRLRVREGDVLELPTPKGPATFVVGGIFRDFSTDQGFLVLDDATFAKWFDASRVTSVGVYVAPGVDLADARDAIARALGPEHLVSMRTSRELRDEGLRVFDETFRVPAVLEIIAIVIAVLGVANTLLELVLDRRAEIVTLRFLGLSRRRVARMLLFEAGLLGLAGTVLGVASGAALSWLLVNVINRQSFGWTIDLEPPYPRLAASVALVFVATIASALYPAREAARLDLRFERETAG